MAIARKSFTTEVGGKTLTIEISQIADQTNASVIVKYGETAVLTTVVMSKSDANTDYLPLKVDYEEKFYAAGKIIGSRFIRRESRPSEDAILAGRLVDRVIRPLFDQRLRREIQIVVTVLAYDEENDPEFPGLIGASVALGISDVPWGGPVAGVRLGQTTAGFLVNPNNSEAAAAPSTKLGAGNPIFDSFVAGARGRINMIELGGYEAKEGDILSGFSLAQKEIDKLVDFQEKIIKEIGRSKAEIALSAVDLPLKSAVEKFLEGRLEEAIYQPTKEEHHGKLGQLKTELFLHLSARGGSSSGGKESLASPSKTLPGKISEGELDYKAADFLFEEVINDIVHKNILTKEKRPDGRKLDQVRDLNGEVSLFPRTHGSALFIRGNTQALAVTTLAPPGQEQLIETMEMTGKRRFLLHYNFPPYSVGEIGSFRGPGRREIGHGNLARKAVEPLIPAKEVFPYTIRVVSEILSSNGSSSMATVCSSVLSLMDAGVPIKKMAAGIAMGLMLDQQPTTNGSAVPSSPSKDNQQPTYKILTDIQGPEDHHGDMDFKAAGTEDGVNAIQMDVKVEGLTLEILEKTLEQAKEARLEILKFMKTVLDKPRPNLSPYVPTIRQLKINPEKIGAVIGPGGKVINGLIKKYSLTTIDVEEDGNVFVSGNDLNMVETAVKEIMAITKEFKVGEMIEGSVIKILEVGAIVDLGGGKDGMIHISELKDGYVKNVSDVLKMGDFVRAKIIRVGEDGRIGLSLKQL